MKKVLALILALVMALSLAACGEKPPKDETPEKPEGPITIKVSVAQSGDGFTALTDAAAAFNASQSDYVVDLYYGGSYTEIMTIMMTSTEADRPDIFASSGNDTAIYIAMEDKMYVPVEDFIKAENYDDSNIVANLRANYQRNGEWQCWPLGNTNVGQYYNTEVLSTYGIDVKELKSYQDIYAACEKLSAAGLKNFYQMRALTHIDWLNYAMTAQGVHYFDNNNGRDGVPTKCLYDDGGECQQATAAFFQYIIDIVKQGDWILDTTISNSDAWIEFAKQNILFLDGYVSGANSIISLVNDNGAFEFSYEVSPVIEAGKPTKGQSPGGGALFIAKTGDYWRQQGAWEFMKYLLNDKVVVDYAMKTGYTPITISGSKTAEYQNYIDTKFPSAATVIEAQAATEEGVAYAPNPISSAVNKIYKDICQKILADPNAYTGESAALELAQRTNEELNLYRITEGLD